MSFRRLLSTLAGQLAPLALIVSSATAAWAQPVPLPLYTPTPASAPNTTPAVLPPPTVVVRAVTAVQSPAPVATPAAVPGQPEVAPPMVASPAAPVFVNGIGGCASGTCGGCATGGCGAASCCSSGGPCQIFHCPPKLVHCTPAPPKICFKCTCPKPICNPCEPDPTGNYGYTPTCWRPWLAPPNYEHCPVPTPAQFMPHSNPNVEVATPVPGNVLTAPTRPEGPLPPSQLR